MWKLNIIGGQPVATLQPNGEITFVAHNETWYAVMTDLVPVPRFSEILLTAICSSLPHGEKPENMNSFMWVGIGGQGEADPTASTINKLESRLDYRGVRSKVSVSGVVVAERALLCIGLEIGRQGMWALNDLPAVIHSIEVKITTPTPEPPPTPTPEPTVTSGWPISRIAENGNFYFVTFKIPKV